MKNFVELKPQEATYDGRKNDAETKTGLDVVNKKKQGRGRGTSTGRGRGSKTNNDVTKSQVLAAPVSAANSQLDVSNQKVIIVYFLWSFIYTTATFFFFFGENRFLDLHLYWQPDSVYQCILYSSGF